jgi:opacity protein-like surface antigen
MLKKDFYVMKKTIMAAVVASALLAAAGANAGNFDGMYFGGGLTSSKGDWSESALNTSGSAETGLNLNLGYGAEFGNFYLGAEFAHMSNIGDLGKGKLVVNRTTTADTETSGGSGSFLSIIPGVIVNPNFMIYGRVGRGHFNFEGTANVVGKTIDLSQDGTMNFVGAGVRYNFTQKAALVVDYMQGKNAEGSADVTTQTVNIGAQYRF